MSESSSRADCSFAFDLPDSLHEFLIVWNIVIISLFHLVPALTKKMRCTNSEKSPAAESFDYLVNVMVLAQENLTWAQDLNEAGR